MANIEELLEATGLPYTEVQWHPKKPPALPYLVYLPIDSNNFGADNAVYVPITRYHIELYSQLKDLASQELVESALKANDVYYEKSWSWIEKEGMHQAVYSIQLQV